MKYFLIGASLCVLIGAITLASTIKRKAEFTYDDFFNELEKKIDNCKNELADKFEGGKCTISADKNSVNVNAELYSTENEEWSKKNITYSVPVSRFSKDEATRNKIKELRNEPNRFDIT